MAEMKLTGKISGISTDVLCRRPRITFTICEPLEQMRHFEELRQVERLSISVKPYRNKRSLNANAYAWQLITEIANVLRAPKEEIYLKLLKRYGQSELISALAHIPINGFVKYYEEAGESTLNGKQFKHYRVYKGSSEFDSREMAILIDGIVSEAQALGIQTETPEELARIKSLWGE